MEQQSMITVAEVGSQVLAMKHQVKQEVLMSRDTYPLVGVLCCFCKTKHQRIVKWDALNRNMLQVESCLSEGKQVETTRTVQKYLPCNNTMVPTPSPSTINQWKPYLRPILSSSRPNLWKRKDESLVERNQLP